ncbi:MAG: hypothetical protein CVU90_11935 [Firmicutes bacterium HGW-Firmicutes-15]|nr:MAG: hypothetical protein CVU90_11935 [Firmicutes bacterium HGW-Firmicutes-15]
MSANFKPYLRMLLIITVGVMLYFIPTREFLKTTFMLGMPFVFILGFMVRTPRYSLVWSICALGLLVVLGAYAYNLVHLPERIQVKKIITSGASLVAEGQYDAAIEKFAGLEKLGKPEQMKEKISEAQTEKEAHQQLETARQLIEAGDKDEAKRIIDALPKNTRAAQESRNLRKSIE